MTDAAREHPGDNESESSLRLASDERRFRPSADLRARVLTSACENAAPALKSWYGPQGLEHNFAKQVQAVLQRATDFELAREYAKKFPLEGVPVSDYRNLTLELSGSGLQLMTGIRFRSLDLTCPFIEIVWQSRPFRDEPELLDVTERVARAYARVRPRFVQFSDTLARPFDPRSCGAVSADRLLVAGLVADVARGTGIQHLDQVSLRVVQPEDIYDRYIQNYAAFQRDNPVLARDVCPQSSKSMAECAAQGSLFNVLVAGIDAGVVALQEKTTDGIAGYCVVGLLLAGAFRGRGLAPAIHVQCCRLLPAAPNAALFGVIAARNFPSLRAALRVGRSILEAKLIVLSS